MDFRGFDSSLILNLRGGILRRVGNFPDVLSQAMLVGIMLVGRLGVSRAVLEINITVISSTLSYYCYYYYYYYYYFYYYYYYYYEYEHEYEYEYE